MGKATSNYWRKRLLRQNLPHLKPTNSISHYQTIASVMVQGQFVSLKGSDAGDLVLVWQCWEALGTSKG